MTSSSTTTLDLAGSRLVARAPGTGVRHVSGGGVPTAQSSARPDCAIVGLGVLLTTRGRLIRLDAAIRHASIVGPERASSYRTQRKAVDVQQQRIVPTRAG